MRHVPVLLNEVVESLNLQSNKNVIDCTLGDGGHTEAILKQIGPDGKVMGIDADPESLLRAKNYLYEFRDRIVFVRDNFDHLKNIVDTQQFGPVNGILMDFGWSSPQFEERGRGFSFQKDEPLDMRYPGEGQGKTAADIVNTASEKELAIILKDYGEETFSEAIAKAVVAARAEKRIERTAHLVELVLGVYRTKLKSKKEVPWVGGLHPATKVFQALRIAVNDELGVIERVLPQAVEVLGPGGRLAVITFHSLEDRIVKHFFKDQTDVVTIITKKPIECGKEEYEANPRARSAKLRVVEKKV